MQRIAVTAEPIHISFSARYLVGKARKVVHEFKYGIVCYRIPQKCLPVNFPDKTFP